MSLVDHVERLISIYDNLNSAYKLASEIDSQLGNNGIVLDFNAKFGEVPILSSKSMKGVDSIDLRIHYRPGSELPEYNFEKTFTLERAHIKDIGYKKKKAEKPDQPVSVEIKIRPHDKEKVWINNTLRFIHQNGEKVTMSDKNYGIVKEFDYLLDVFRAINIPEIIEYQNIVNRSSIGNTPVEMLNSLSSEAQLIHVETWAAKQKMDLFSDALRILFKEKGYTTRNIDIGLKYKKQVRELKRRQAWTKKIVNDLEGKLEQENILCISEEQAHFLHDLFEAIEPFLEKYTHLQKKFGKNTQVGSGLSAN